MTVWKNTLYDHDVETTFQNNFTPKLFKVFSKSCYTIYSA